MKNKMLKMLKMQDKLNEKTIGKHWRNISIKNGKLIDWDLAISIEVAELIDSLNYKWWKNEEPDYENAKVEAVDIFHFMLSSSMNKSKYTDEKIVDLILSKLEPPVLDRKLLDIAKTLLHFPSYSDFFLLIRKLGMNFDELYDRYMVKNILNEIRQNNGYNNGTYIKNWNGKEDNVVALKIVSKMDNNEKTPLNIYGEIDSYYYKNVLANR